MTIAHTIAPGPASRRRIVKVLMLSSRTIHMFGEYVREGAILIVVFVPLDMRKANEAFDMHDFFTRVLPASLLMLAFGIAIEHMSVWAAEWAQELEVEHGI